MKQSLYKKALVFTALVYFFLANTLSLIEDILEDEHDGIVHFIYEGTITIITILSIYIIWKELIFNKIHINQLKKDLKKADSDTKDYSNKIKTLKHELLQVIKEQFDDWSLTKTEQEIALLLLKGLSLIEIAQIRDTKEKTIRQQASHIYKKSNLKGRHELSAYFIEDLF